MDDSYTLLICAKTRSNRSFTTMRRLLENGCNINCRDSDGKTALHYASQRGVGVELLLRFGANPDIQDNDGNVPILVASTEGFDEVICSLVDKGCNPDICNKAGFAAIHFLAMKNHHRAIEAIAHGNGDVNLAESYGRSPLWYAVNHNRHRAIKTLLRNNCDVDPAPRYCGDPTLVPLKVALQKGLFGTAKLLVLAGCQLGALYQWLDHYEEERGTRARERANRIRLFVDTEDESDSDSDPETTLLEDEAYDWFQDWVHSPHSLRQLCRIAIRRFIGAHLLRRAHELQLPGILRDYVTLKEVDDHHLHGELM